MQDRSGLTLGLDVTYSYNAYTCIAWMYPIHILSAYLTVVFGIACFATRFRMKEWHAVSGRGFMIAMYFGYGSAILIHNKGTPLSIIIFMTAKLISMSIGWCAIKRHKWLRENELTKRLAALWKDKSSVTGMSYEQIVKQQKAEMNSERTTFASRFLTWKAAHGLLMAYAWFMMFGRTVVTDPFEAFDGCYTYPAFKTTEGPIEYLPQQDPEFFTPEQERAFILGPSLGGASFILLVGVLSSWYFARDERKARDERGAFLPSHDEPADHVKLSPGSPKRVTAQRPSTSSAESSLFVTASESDDEPSTSSRRRPTDSSSAAAGSGKPTRIEVETSLSRSLNA